MTQAWLESGLLGRVRQLVRPWSCHLVGGAVRDRLLGRTVHDLDLVVDGDGEVALALASALGGKVIPLGGDRFTAVRVVGEGFVLDLWDRSGTTLEQELRRRDLTINAIAVDLADGSWHDPLRGRADIEDRVLRAITDESFADDPLRVLRLARLSAQLDGFAADSRTRRLAADSVADLTAVAAERRREELGLTLATPRPEPAIALWAEIGFYPTVFGGAADPSGSAASAAVRRARRYADQLSVAHRVEVGDRRPLHAALAISAARGDVARPQAAGYFSRREARAIALVEPWRHLPADEASQRWFLHRASEMWPAALIHAAVWAEGLEAAQAGERFDAMARLALDEGAAIFDPEPLLRGDEIRRLLELDSGPAVGVAAKRLRRAQVEGRVSDADAARRWLSERRS